MTKQVLLRLAHRQEVSMPYVSYLRNPAFQLLRRRTSNTAPPHKQHRAAVQATLSRRTSNAEPPHKHLH